VESLLWGYCVADYAIALNPPDDTLFVKLRRAYDYKPVPTAFVWPGGPRFSPCQPSYLWPDKRCPINQLHSAVHRFGGALPPGDRSVVQHFVSYARHVIRAEFGQLPDDEMASFSLWAAECSRGRSYARNLAQKRKDTGVLEGAHYSNASFLKHESYAEPKYPRSINSYSDFSKGVLGPVFKKVDECLFRHRCFVKGKSLRERNDLLNDAFGTQRVFVTDFSSFECHHRAEFAKLGCFWVFHVLANTTFASATKRLFAAFMLGTNTCEFPAVRCELAETLMSGAVWTSSANSALNLLLMSYLYLRSTHGCLTPRELAKRFSQFHGFVEGDDGICGDFHPECGLVEALGLKLKFASFRDYSDSGFCGTFVPEVGDVDLCCDPRKVLSNFFVLDYQHHNCRPSVQAGLLRAKALSYYYQYSSCPIVGPMAYATLERTRGITPLWVSKDTYRAKLEAEIQHHAVATKFYRIPPVVSTKARVFIEEKFGFSLSWQQKFENTIAEWGQGHNVTVDPHPELEPFYAHFRSMQGREVPGSNPNLIWAGAATSPLFSWTNVSDFIGGRPSRSKPKAHRPVLPIPDQYEPVDV
jgi:hypothetical protein